MKVDLRIVNVFQLRLVISHLQRFPDRYVTLTQGVAQGYHISRPWR